MSSAEHVAGPGRTRSVTAYDFRRPNKFNREHVRALEMANETFARQFTTVLSTALRAVSQVSLLSVGQLTYDEYVRSLPNPSYLAILSLHPLSGAGIFHLPLPVTMAVIDRMLGGSGHGKTPQRPLTDIEDSLIRNLMNRVLRELSYAFDSLLDGLEAKVASQESNPQFAQIAAPSDMVVLVAFEVRIGAVEGEATLCIPFTSLQPVLDNVTSNSLYATRFTDDPDGVAAAVGDAVGEAPVEVSLRFSPVTLRSSAILDLRPGDVIPLHHPVGAPLAVAVAGLNRFIALPGRNGKRLACLLVDPDHKDA